MNTPIIKHDTDAGIDLVIRYKEPLKGAEINTWVLSLI
jgi:hypothetical protein